MKRKIMSNGVIVLLLSIVLSVMLLGTSIAIFAQEVTLPREQTFVFSMAGGASPSYNPVQYWNMEEYSMDRIPIVYEWLAYWDQLSGEYKPWLARSWKWVDSNTFVINLREEPYFKDGSPVTARDVAFSLNILGNETFGGPLVTAFQTYIESIEAVDERTVRVNIAKGYEHDIRVYTILEMPIFPEKIWARLIEEKGVGILDYLNNDPEEMIASGPYTLYTSTPTRTIWVRVDNWWGQKIGWSVAPKYVVIQHLDSYEQESRLFRNGEIDCMHDTVEGEYEFITSNRDRFGAWDVDAPDWGGMGAVGASGGQILALNMKIPIFRQKWFRYALAYAIDYDKIAEVNAFYAWGSTSLIHPSFPLYSDYVNETAIIENFETERDGGFLHIKYDPEKAIEILSQHCEGSPREGWTWQGQKIGPFTINIVSGWTDAELAFEIVSRCLKNIGIETEVVGYTYGAWAAKLEQRDFEMSYTERIGIGPFEPFQSWYECFIGGQTCWDSSPADYQIYWNGSYPECENTAQIVKDLIEEGFRYPIGSPESIKIAKRIQGIVVPQLTFIPINRHYSFVGKHCKIYWVNWPTKDDPYEHHESINTLFTKLINIRSTMIETVSVSVTPGVVEVGEPATISVTLKNNGEYDHLHRVEVSLGPAKAGPGPEILAYNITSIPAGATKTVTMKVAFNEPGSYTLTVDEWRIGKYDPGEPIQITLIVSEKAPFEESLQEAINAAREAKSAAEAAKQAANEAKSAAEAALIAAQNAAPMWTVWLSMVITIVVILCGVYVLTRRQG